MFLFVQVAYVPQSAFIYNASVRDNILFGLPFQQERYDQAIAAAAVRPDLDNMAGMSAISCEAKFLTPKLLSLVYVYTSCLSLRPLTPTTWQLCASVLCGKALLQKPFCILSVFIE